MKKYIYIISLAAFFISSDIIYATKIEENNNKHVPKLNNYNPYHNLKESDFDNSNFSNEKQYDNENNSINNEKYIQPHSINNNSLQNKKDINNTKLTLYNEYNKTNNLDDFRNFNHEHEKTNNRLIEINKSFLQITVITQMNKDIFDVVDVIYGVNDNNEKALWFFYEPLHFSEYILKILDKLNISQSTDKSKLKKDHDEVYNDIIRIKELCKPKKLELISEINKMHDPFYNFYNDPPMDDYKSYTASKTDYLNCLKDEFEKIKNKPNNIISYEKDVYIKKCKNSIKLKDLSKKDSGFCKNVTHLGPKCNRDWEVPKDKEVVPFIDFLITEIKKINNLKTLVTKLEFMKKQLADIISKHNKHIEICKKEEASVNTCTKNNIDNNNCNQHFNEVKKIGDSYSILEHNHKVLEYLESIRIGFKDSVIYFFKLIGELLIKKVDSNGNIIEKDDIDHFDLLKPKSIFKSLEDEFHKIFENKWEFYKNKQNLDKSKDIMKNTISLILPLMDKFTNLNKSMVQLKNKGILKKFSISSQIKNKLNVSTYPERKEGFLSSIELAKSWEKEKEEIIKKLNEENEETVQLDIKIRELFKKYLDELAEKKYIEDLKLELNNKIKDITEKIKYVKKTVDLKKEVEKDIVYIDELAKQPPYQITEYIEKKNTIYDTIKSDIKQIYVDDIDLLYNEMSSVLQENTINNIENKTELETLKSKIDNVYNKIKHMETEAVEKNLNNIETNKNKLSGTILEIKKYIYGEIDKELNKTLNDFKNKEQELSNKINDYTKENDKLSVYKSKILEIRNYYNDQINIDNTKGEEAKENYDKSNEHMKTIPTNEYEISEAINEVKRMKNELLSKVDKYVKFDNIYNGNVDSEHNKFIDLTNKIKNEVSDEKLSKHETKFNGSKSLINETKKSIDDEYQNINTLKKVDEYIKVCKRTKESITNFFSKQTTLKDKLNQNINTIKKIDPIEKPYKDQFENRLINKISELDKKFKDASLNDHESNNNGLMEYFNNLKANLGKNKEKTLYHEFDEKEKAVNNIIKTIEDINKNISNIEIEIYTSIYNINEEIEDAIGKNIKLLNDQVVKKVNENVTNLSGIKEKLKRYNFLDFGKEENIKYINEIKIKNDINTLDQKIDKSIETLTKIKKTSESHIGEIKGQTDKLEKVADINTYNEDPKEIEKKIENVVKKIDKKKNIYKEINKLLNEISEIEKDKTSLEELKNINLSYGRSLGNIFLEQIDEEKKKAERTIKAMEAYIEDLDNIKKKSDEIEKDMKIKMDINEEMKALNISNDDDRNYHTKSKDHKKGISDIHDKSSKIIQNFSKESDINNIKNELQENVSESRKHNSDINHYLSKVENIYNILKLNKIKKIIDKVKEYTDEIKKNNKSINDELINSGKIITKIKENSSLTECQSKIESTIDDNYISKCIKDIADLKTYILSEENNINTYLKNAENYNENVLLNFHNIEMGDTKSQYILNIKKNSGTNNSDYNINELKEHKEKSNGYKDEAGKNTETIKKNKELFEKYKQDVTVLLNKYYAVELKNKFDKTKIDSEQIIKEIKEAHTNCISQSGKSEQKMNEIKNEKIHIEDEVANNDKSNKAILNIKLSVDQFETKFIKINDIKKKSDECLKETENIENKISTLSIDTQETRLKENGEIFGTLKKFLESLKNQKKNIDDQKKELDGVNSKIENIESNVNQHKKNYEIGIVEKINEIAKANKDQIESTKKLIIPTIEKLTSSFKTNDLEGIDTNENLGTYNKEMNKTYNEFMESYNLIVDYLETVSKESITYGEIKNKRISTQKELLKSIENVNKAKSYLDDIETNEFDRIVTHFKKKINDVNDKFTNEYSKVNKGFDNISNSINNVKKSTDENLLLSILNQTKEMYANIVSKKYYSYKYEAENIFINISKLANSLNIQIQNSSGIDLHKNINIAIVSYLNSQKEDMLSFIPSPQKTSETYKKISDSYNTLLDIFKKSQELQKKEQQALNLIFENRLLHDKVQATNELKDTLSDLKNKKEQILNKVKLLLHKSNELNKLSCNSQNYDTILESSKYDKIKEKSNNYEQEKNKLGIDFDVTAMEKKFNNDIKDIEELENNYKHSDKDNYNFSEENNNILQSKKKLKELSNAFNAEIKKIEDKIIEKNGLINKLIETRKECMFFTYTTLVEALRIKITDYSKFITSATKFSKEFLKYIDDTSNSLNDDINTLQTKYDLNQIKKHVTSMFADATNDNNNLIEKEKEATKTINNLTELFTIDSNNIDADVLHNNKIQMIYFNSELHKSIDSIKQLYKKMHVFKLLNIGHINKKYFDISKEFDNILQLQESELKENLNDLKKIGQKISDKKNKFLNELSEIPIPNFNTLKEIYHEIVKYESQIDEIKNITNDENDNITLYMDIITKLMKKVESILNFVTTYENDSNVIKQHIQDNNENDVSKIKDNLKKTIESFQKILNKLNEIKAQFYDNNNINNVISTISQDVIDVKKHISKDLTIENELIEIQKSLEYIKKSTYDIRSEQITKYVNPIHDYVEQQTKKIQNDPNKDEIDDLIQEIVNYNKESELKLPTIINNKDNVTPIISRIDKVINLIKSEYNNNDNVSYNVAKKLEEDANSIIRDLDTSQNMLNDLIQKNLKIIDDLKNKKQEIENRNNLQTINREQEITQTEHVNNTYHHDINDINDVNDINDTNDINQNHQNSSSDKKDYSKTRNTGNAIRYAGAIAFGLVTFYVIIRIKEKKDKDEMEFDKSKGFYDGGESTLFERKDEVIEIDMNEDLSFN
ncbi:reticulocyte binding protein, putative [Plasmodium yoelii]|uniref:Reticulocyte binding protein n=2 Tax=Plasmodium yoelii TaxID=5861 RepID=A0AAE9WV71_PLAYO|nr:reticulocyte binding protein, putative [Plasmodium yoelii]WBY57098.1 reticulocyte binding protein [Plasmodium yoelii yoelii]VTZ78214.1 reticulocyte binding protein, putative [Plasmodium yoelii]|eukprot:XP_022812100.1 reticulocyte binding protein, putative [Plasmodium yoelii]